MNRRLFFTVTASLLLCLSFKPAFSQTNTRRPSLTYPDRQGQTDKGQTDTRVNDFTITQPDGSVYTPTSDSEPLVSYDRFENITWYEMRGLILAPWNSRSDYSGLSPQLYMTAQFGCTGDSGQKPCLPNQVVLVFSYTNFFSRGEYTYKYPPFNYQQRSVIAIADGKRTPLGILSVNSKAESGSVSVRGILAVSLQTFRQLAFASSVEMKVGILPVTLTSVDLETLANFYNLAILNRRTPTINPNRPPAKRGKRRGSRS